MAYDLSDYLKLRLALLGGVGFSALAAWRLSQKFKDDMQHLRRVKPGDKSLFQHYDLPKGIPVYHKPDDAFEGNAFYYPREYAALGNSFKSLFGDKVTEKDKREAATGYIGLGRGAERFGVLAHELGHAEMGNKPIYHPERFNQSVLLHPVSQIVSRVGGVVGTGVGSMALRDHLHAHGVQNLNTLGGVGGAGIGAVAGVLSSLPQLVNEYQASAKAMKAMEASGASPAELQKTRKALRSAYMTYVANSALFPATLGVALGSNVFGTLK